MSIEVIQKNIIKLISIIALILTTGCGGDDNTATPATQKASRDIADYMFTGAVGTEYWYDNNETREDTNNIVVKNERDTAVFRIVNRNYNHSVLGNSIQIELTERGIVQDTVYYSLKDNQKIQMYRKNKIYDFLSTPFEFGTPYSHGDIQGKLHEFDVSVKVKGKDYVTIVGKEILSETDSKGTTYETIFTTYFTEGVNICKKNGQQILTYKSGKKAKTTFSSELLFIR